MSTTRKQAIESISISDNDGGQVALHRDTRALPITHMLTVKSEHINLTEAQLTTLATVLRIYLGEQTP